MQNSGLWGSVFLGVAGTLVLFKVWMKVSMGVCKSKNRLDGKTVVVTGANSGVGFETAKDLAKRGATIIMVCRDMKKAAVAKDLIVKESGNTNVMLIHVDFTSLLSVRKCADEVLKNVSRIDILLNNAGTVSDSFTMNDDGLDVLMCSNYFGPFLFTNILLGVVLVFTD